jgi:hypothetical protein
LERPAASQVGKHRAQRTRPARGGFLRGVGRDHGLALSGCIGLAQRRKQLVAAGPIVQNVRRRQRIGLRHEQPVLAVDQENPPIDFHQFGEQGFQGDEVTGDSEVRADDHGIRRFRGAVGVVQQRRSHILRAEQSAQM